MRAWAMTDFAFHFLLICHSIYQYLVNQDPTKETETARRFYRREVNANLITLVIE